MDLQYPIIIILIRLNWVELIYDKFIKELSTILCPLYNRPIQKISPTKFIRLAFQRSTDLAVAIRRQSTLLNEHQPRETSAFLHGRLEFD